MLEFICVYKRTLYRNIKNGYTIFSIDTKDERFLRNDYGYVLCKGNIPTYAIGMPLKITGEWEYTCQDTYFKVYKIFEYSDNEDVTIQFLSNGLVKGISKRIAKKIVEVFGADIFSVVCKTNSAEIISNKIPRVTKEQAELLVDKIKIERNKREIYEYISKFGGNYSTAISLAEEYRDSWKIRLKENPYLFGQKFGLSFYICDSIAKEEGFSYVSEQRINSLIYEALYMGLNSGHTYLTQVELNNKITKIIKQSAYPYSIPAQTITYHLMKSKFVRIENGSPCRVYLKSICEFENNAANDINRLENRKISLRYDEKVIDSVENELGIKYANAQRKAFEILKDTGIKIITGGPGTGKTTTIHGIIKAFQNLNPGKKIVLCAPTGRAAQRMSETTGMYASTIHKLLDFQCFGTDISHKDRSNPIDADFIIVDETSMLDIEIFSILLNAVKEETILCFLGDANQLPSVGAGNVLQDMIQSGKIDVYRLDMVFRQGETSNIVKNCHHMLYMENLEVGPDFQIWNLASKKELENKTLELVKKIYSKDEPFDLQILSPIKNGEGGIYSLNAKIQKCVNQSAIMVPFGKHEFHLHDKIIMNVNNYESGYFNGNMGIIKQIETDRMILDINGDEIEILEKDYENMLLAYATTIHKSQGSEFLDCIIVLPENSGKMLTRNLIFTAISRAKRNVYILNENNALESAMKNNSVSKRNTRLKEKILGEREEYIYI